MDWVHEYVPGQVRASCSVCGCSRRFPDNLTYCIDKLFRCERCMEITALERDMQIQSYRQQPDELESSLSVGLQPQGDTPSTFLVDAAEGRAAVLPGWTPSSTFYDDFTVVGGGVGSSWTAVAVSGAVISQPEEGVTRFAPGTDLNGGCDIQLLSFSVPLPSAGRFYCRARFRTTSIGAVTTPVAIGVGTATVVSQRLSIGFRGNSAAGNAYYQLVSQAVRHATSEVPSDTTTYHIGEIWWNGNGYVYGSVDGGGPTMNVPTSGASAKFPSIIATNAGVAPTTASVLDVTDYYCAA